ncbi:hypothetical protein AB1Y20_017562 [Prymnesium parvum]|uniref:Uncharacterized protein n=1 Tax=Prymnesium parvum TaxID=97485 RepID=A0AB34JPD4_PRYPA
MQRCRAVKACARSTTQAGPMPETLDTPAIYKANPTGSTTPSRSAAEKKAGAAALHWTVLWAGVRGFHMLAA